MSVELRVSKDGVAHLNIDGPISQEWADALVACTGKLHDRGDARVVIVGGTGRFFCPGGDLSGMTEDTQQRVGTLASTLHVGLRRLRSLDAPTIARVHSTAAGAGFSLVLGCDFAIAGSSATFTTAYTAVGLTPDGGMSWLLPRRVGWPRATELILTARRFDAEEALAMGLITQVVDDDALTKHVENLAAQLADGPTATFGAARRLLDHSASATFDAQLDAEALAVAAAAASPNGQAGIAAFLARERPQFPR